MSVDIDPATGTSASDVPAPPIEAAHFRHVLGHFASGVTIVTSMDGEEPVGFACQSFSSVSLVPPMVAVCAGLGSTTWPRIRSTGHFCVNILAEQQEELSRVFAVSGAEKFRGVGWTRSPGGCPRLDDVLAWIDCDIVTETEAGDHLVVLGRVRGLDVAAGGNGRPLLFFRGGYGRFAV